jgi:hypothetical protein
MLLLLGLNAYEVTFNLCSELGLKHENNRRKLGLELLLFKC